ncbi:hypothetical protein ACIBG7_12260 [Nonomuraea sp. NPDC050328]|uniref:hypothetical protein n=1 Tax=Nonomuraea sp. NPDC050328 TaxID=3364361 RepID=UPI0037BAE04A
MSPDIVWSRLRRPMENDWPCGATGCDDLSEVAATIDGWHYGLCRSDAELIPGFDPRLLEAEMTVSPPETTQQATT